MTDPGNPGLYQAPDAVEQPSVIIVTVQAG
jgi:hypothetical protein